MRVIAGKAKGRKLISPKGDAIRPTSDRLKESLFNILGPFLPEARVLDLFAGTGSLGIEALSRGANFVVFSEKNRKAVEIIMQNIQLTGFQDQSKIVPGDAFRFLKTSQDEFDLIIADPPYIDKIGQRVLVAIAQLPWLNQNTIIVIEHHKEEIMPKEHGPLENHRQIKQGIKSISFYRLKE